MREIDQALARAYAQRGASDPGTVPPAPHLVPRSKDDAHASPIPAPHLLENPEWDDAPEPFLLHWPATVRILERDCGDRFEQMAEFILGARDTQGMKVLLFTSCHRAEGRTTLVLTLARALARRAGRTLLVEGDLTGPMLARQLGLRPTVGLDDVVEHGTALNDALIDVPDEHLTILPLRAPVARPREFLASTGWSCTLSRLRRDFDLVLIDGSPLFAGLSAAALHRSVDGAILVQNHTLTGQRALLRAQEILNEGGVPLLGLAETFV
ncbi:MAG: cobalamin biosynthesis protein CobQ [Isosphaeraceae bacterium]|nr:cobalamin biosynthesis protein CobQ [Isosphaeraceae bacterium]